MPSCDSDVQKIGCNSYIVNFFSPLCCKKIEKLKKEMLFLRFYGLGSGLWTL